MNNPRFFRNGDDFFESTEAVAENIRMKSKYKHVDNSCVEYNIYEVVDELMRRIRNLEDELINLKDNNNLRSWSSS